jgi:hypothetical protein
MRSIYSYTVRNIDSILLPKDTFQLLGNNPIMKQDVHQSTTCINIGIINALRYWEADLVIFLTTFLTYSSNDDHRLVTVTKMCLQNMMFWKILESATRDLDGIE